MEVLGNITGLTINLSTIGWLSGLAIIIVTVIIENASKKFRPWSVILNWIGKRINKDISERLKNVEESIEKIKEVDVLQDEIRDERDAISIRRRIISAADELRRGVEHSEEWFNNVLDDVTDYLNYCDTHDHFKNEKAVASIELIRSVYHKVLVEDKFL